jgi:hypothetical protein
MINVDLTKMLHPRIWDVLPAFLPGMCFEVSVFLAKPQLLQTIASQAHLDRYSAAGIALIGAFVLGVAFTCWATLLQSGVFRLRRREKQFWPKLWIPSQEKLYLPP